ncbi:uncharacterized protein MYCGRDRAFT_42731 [Zymoseptoria tritici IPO323]|nr:uncharacterized protein MYCGRDRAFT_42731 [Zymoseptoria tritici IPO323]EGP87657.1 hypothetical protein MYCGRDRAFT_42731 [Zymoseptoria tritici IPO323]
MTFSNPGGILMLLVNLAYSIGAFFFDYSDTHVLNPRWPPHAKFHNGQTMSLGAMQAALSIYLILRPTANKTEKRDSLWLAALVGSLYCAAGLSAILYPGTKWADPEFAANGEQKFIFGGCVVLIWAGYWVETRRLQHVKGHLMR